ncbi:MAG: DNA starvation/stationary phase protection protein Dps [Planctomycetota bacterium]
MHPTRNDLPAATREKTVKLLNGRLADALDLYHQAKQAHWNVKGPNFQALHAFFDELSAHALAHADELAERAVALGGIAEGRTPQVAKASTIPGFPASAVSGPEHLKAVIAGLATFAEACRKAIDTTDGWGDAVTADLLTGIVAAVDKDLWMAEANLQAKA